MYLIQFPHAKLGVGEVPISAVSLYRGGTEETLTPLSKRMKAILLKYGVAYQV